MFEVSQPEGHINRNTLLTVVGSLEREVRFFAIPSIGIRKNFSMILGSFIQI